jgi:hypothetical protein
MLYWFIVHAYYIMSRRVEHFGPPCVTPCVLCTAKYKAIVSVFPETVSVNVTERDEEKYPKKNGGFVFISLSLTLEF